MPSTIEVRKPEKFSFLHTIGSHGWYDLAPFEIDRSEETLSYVFRNTKGAPVRVTMSDASGAIRVRIDDSSADKAAIRNAVRHILRIDDDLSAFYAKAADIESLKWIGSRSAGRLLRSPTVFEDVVKTMCTTNCSWGLTRNMVNNLVSKLGQSGDHGNAFPTPEAMASVDEAFYRDEIRAGYRSPYFVELAQEVAEGSLDPEAWLASELPTAELKKELKSIKGFGDYAAENLLKLLGRYDGLALDSWLRAKFYERHNRGKKCPDAKIERHYRDFGEWKGLAIWCDMTEKWFENSGSAV